MQKSVFQPLIYKASSSKILSSSNVAMPEEQASFLMQLLKAGFFSIQMFYESNLITRLFRNKYYKVLK